MKRNSNEVDAGAHTGGILADVMGLGKTLTMLMAIVLSKKAAERYGETNVQDQRQLVPTKGTLVVVTSRRKLSGSSSLL